jgi:hypothetical protein
MYFRAHDRFLISASLVIIIAAFTFTIPQGAGNDRYIMASANDCVESRGELRLDATTAAFGTKKPCSQTSYSAEPFALLLFGIGLTGFAHAARRHFARLS